MSERPYRIIISGGGTGGHIYPALSIASSLMEMHPDSQILFVGAKNRMEMTRVPEAGYRIIGLPIEGFDRRNPIKNILVLMKILLSQFQSWRILRDFRPDVAVGVGGYASGPLLKTAQQMGIPTLIQEQNSYAGVTNKLLSRKAGKICVAYGGMERYFPKDKILVTGNPIRGNLSACGMSREEAIRSFLLDPGRRTILVIGGSLGAGTFNRTLEAQLDTIQYRQDVNIIWQTGRSYIREVESALRAFTQQEHPLPVPRKLPNLHVTEYLSDMARAYRAADLVISRAGASSVSELCCLGKPVILVPSPNVAEDHQTKNAMALKQKGAACLIKDSEAAKTLLTSAYSLLGNEAKMKSLRENILTLALPDAGRIIAECVIQLIKEHEKH